MDSGRRKALQGSGGAVVLGLAFAAGLSSRQRVGASWNKAAFETKSLNDAVKAMGERAPPKAWPSRSLPRHRRERRGRSLHHLSKIPRPNRSR